MRELKVNFPRNRKYLPDTRVHTHTQTDTLHMTEDSNQFLYTIPKKKKKLSREMLLFNSHKNGEQYELCKKRNTEATTYGNFTCVETCAPPPTEYYGILATILGYGKSEYIPVLQVKKPDFRTAGICPRSPSYHDLEP